MSPLKGLKLAALLSLTGAVLLLAPFGMDVEERYGLPWLFAARGVVPASPRVAVVAIDRRTGPALDLPEAPDDWPRSVHAELTRRLSAACAAGIVFDLFFAPRQSAADRAADESFARAMREAGNVILVGHLTQPHPSSGDWSRAIETLNLPAPIFVDAAAAVAPFPLPNAPDAVIGYWTFKTSAGDLPTLPATAAHLFLLSPDDRSRLALAAAIEHAELPSAAGISPAAALPVTALIAHLREVFHSDPERIARLRSAFFEGAGEPEPAIQRKWLRLEQLHRGNDWRYVNFPGPAGTVTTVNYADVLQRPAPSDCAAEPAFAGRLVFVGASEFSPVEQKDKDVFDTVFTQESGLKLSGPEIAATATADLIEGRSIERLSLDKSLPIALFWGSLIGLLWRSCGVLWSVTLTLAAAGVYLTYANHQFARHALWLPLTTPLLQVLLGVLLAGLRNRAEAEALVGEIRNALRDWLPPEAIAELVKRPRTLRRTGGLVYGVCLYTGLEGFTAFSERLAPLRLEQTMRDYYRRAGQPITRRGGYVTEQTGESMLAVWASGDPDLRLKQRALEVALELAAIAPPSAASQDAPSLRTRIGIHAGRIATGTAPFHPAGRSGTFGFIVSASRCVQAINQPLGTSILASEEAIEDLFGEFICRPVGSFVAQGLITPVRLFEVLGRREEIGAAGQYSQPADTRPPRSGQAKLFLCEAFGEALAAYHNMRWQDACAKFLEILDDFPEDGPALFYLRRAEYFRHNPPLGVWDPVNRL